eukprot:365522-Chlamydomonas_euryale.AAC.19
MPPRSKAAARKKARAAVASGAKKGKSAPQLSASQLYEQAQVALQFDDVEGAAEALRRAVKLEPDNAEVRALRWTAFVEQSRDCGGGEEVGWTGGQQGRRLREPRRRACNRTANPTATARVVVQRVGRGCAAAAAAATAAAVTAPPPPPPPLLHQGRPHDLPHVASHAGMHTHACSSNLSDSG